MLGYVAGFYWIYSKALRKQRYQVTSSELCVSPVDEELAPLNDRPAPNHRSPNARSVGYVNPKQRLIRISCRAWDNGQIFLGWEACLPKNNLLQLMSGQRFTVEVEAVSKLEGNDFQ
jgi:hypothetical protein